MCSRRKNERKRQKNDAVKTKKERNKLAEKKGGKFEENISKIIVT
jgi:hypothetical protein